MGAHPIDVLLRGAEVEEEVEAEGAKLVVLVVAAVLLVGRKAKKSEPFWPVGL